MGIECAWILSDAVEFVAANREDTSIAAIGSSVQAETYGLHIVITLQVV